MTNVQILLCFLSKNKQTNFSVANTLVHFYGEVMIVQNEPNINAEFHAQLRQTGEHLLNAILDIQSNVVHIVLVAYFDRINEQPELVQQASDGCMRFIVRFMSIEWLETNIEVLNRIIRLGENRVHGRHLLRLCSRDSIIRELTTIITQIRSVRAQRLAIELAIHIQELVFFRAIEFEFEHLY